MVTVRSESVRIVYSTAGTRGGTLSECGIESPKKESLVMPVSSLERPPGGICGQEDYRICLGGSGRKTWGWWVESSYKKSLLNVAEIRAYTRGKTRTAVQNFSRFGSLFSTSSTDVF